MRALRTILLAATLVVGAAAGCGGGGAPAAATGTGGAGGNMPDGGTGGAGGAGGAGGGIPLVDWVTDLASNYTETSAPDTVDDKVVIDNSDPSAFDPLLQR
jgi:hypothetical protein